MDKIKPVQPGENVQIEITDIAEDGKGIGRASGLAIFVEAVAAVPIGDGQELAYSCVVGDLLTASITKAKKNYATAKLLRVDQPAQSRTTADCPYFGLCGGCALREMDYEAQLELKREHVASKLQRIGGLDDPTVNPVVADYEGMRYRNKAVFSVHYSEAGAVVGFKGRASNRTVDVADCLIQKSPAMAVAAAIRELIDARVLTVYSERTGKGFLREFTVKLCEGSGAVMVVLTGAAKELKRAEDAIYAIDDAISACADAEGYCLESVVLEYKPGRNINDPARDYIVLAGTKTVTDVVQIGRELRYEISAPAFYQVNTPQMVKLYNLVAEYANLTGGETLFDLYCGIGTIGLTLADTAGMVIGIEKVKSAIVDANRNAVINGIVNARYYAGDAEDIMPRLFDREDKLYADYLDEAAERVAIIDPPRAGCDEQLLQTLKQAGVSRIVYISCDPGSLARDVGILTSLGYHFIAATPVEMFKFSTHVETVVLMSLKDSI